jgi:hypothetical protein
MVKVKPIATATELSILDCDLFIDKEDLFPIMLRGYVLINGNLAEASMGALSPSSIPLSLHHKLLLG